MNSETPNFKTIRMGHRYYQHIGEGGYTYQLVRTDHVEGTRKFTTMQLRISLTCYGQPLMVELPMFATNAKIFQELANHIRQEANAVNFDPKYLSEQGVGVAVINENGDTVEKYTKADALSNQHANSLEVLMQTHRIAVFPEFESQMWHAEIFDNESATPTRKALGNSPLAAALTALAQEVPEFGDALDTHRNRDEFR